MVTYSPARKAKGWDSFSYTVTDGGSSATASVYVSIQSNGGKGRGKKGKRATPSAIVAIAC